MVKWCKPFLQNLQFPAKRQGSKIISLGNKIDDVDRNRCPTECPEDMIAYYFSKCFYK